MSARSIARRDALWLAMPALGGTPACAEVGGDLHFPEKEHAWSAQVRAAKKICGSCEVRSACLEWALRREEPFGVWGGMTTPERRVVLDQRDATTSTEVAA